jgi:hypothetical protein
MSTDGPIPDLLFGGTKIQSAHHRDDQQVVVSIIDETDGSRADETIHFGLDGAQFELHLSKIHAEELRQTLAPYIKVARKAARKGNGQRRGLAANL